MSGLLSGFEYNIFIIIVIAGIFAYPKIFKRRSLGYASFTPAVGSTISLKPDANLLVCSNINQAGNTIQVNAQLIDSGSEEVIKPFQTESASNEKIT